MSDTTIKIDCPKVHREVDTGIEVSPASLAASWDKMLRLRCPHCGEVHATTVRDAFTTSVVSDRALRQAS